MKMRQCRFETLPFGRTTSLPCTLPTVTSFFSNVSCLGSPPFSVLVRITKGPGAWPRGSAGPQAGQEVREEAKVLLQDNRGKRREQRRLFSGGDGARAAREGARLAAGVHPRHRRDARRRRRGGRAAAAPPAGLPGVLAHRQDRQGAGGAPAGRTPQAARRRRQALRV